MTVSHRFSAMRFQRIKESREEKASRMREKKRE
jgi:hypothetical protein